MGRFNNINIFLSTFNFVLCFVGASFIYTIFLPLDKGTEIIVTSVTAPYRYFALGISIIVILINIGYTMKLPGIIKLFLFFWMLFLARMIFDLELDLHSFTRDQVNKQWQLTIGMVIIPMISILLSYKTINVQKAFYCIYAAVIIMLCISLFSRGILTPDYSSSRTHMNLALGSMQFGHMGVTGVILSIKYFIGKNKLRKIVAIGVTILSIIVILGSGSRSPMFALFIILIFFLLSIIRNKTVGLLFSCVAVLFTIGFFDSILKKVETISPVMANRLSSTIEEGDISGREIIYGEALELFSQSPLLGKQFYLEKDYGEGFRYSHNILLDSLIALGIIGGALMLYILYVCIKRSYIAIRTRDSNFWICLILVQQILFSMVSGAFYNNQLLNVLIVFTLLYFKKTSLFLKPDMDENCTYSWRQA